MSHRIKLHDKVKNEGFLPLSLTVLKLCIELQYHYIKILVQWVCVCVTEVGRDYSGDMWPSYLLYFVLNVCDH